VTVASSGGVIGVRDRGGQTRLIDAGPDGRARVRVADGRMRTDPAFLRLQGALDREGRRGLGTWAVAARVSGDMVAVAHRGNLLIGAAGPAVQM
jgi:hypothetical protein